MSLPDFNLRLRRNIPTAIRIRPRIRKTGRITKTITPIYGFCAGLKASSNIRKIIKPKLTSAIAAPVSVREL